MRSPRRGRPAGFAAGLLLLVAGLATADVLDAARARFQVSGEPLPGRFPPAGDWRGIGAGPAREPLPAGSNLVPVANTDELRSAMAVALPGDVLLLAPGDYPLQRTLYAERPGEAGRPVRVLAERPGSVRIRVATTVGFELRAPYWWFEGLDIAGVCADHGDCEHAFHIVGDAHHTVLRNNRLHEFNAPVKINGSERDGRLQTPDDGRIDGNSLYNSGVRLTGNPVTLIDAVAVSGWTVRANLIADFVKGGGDNISYGAFFKGAGSGNVFERNLVICEMNLHPPYGARVGLSFGGGGTGAQYCRDGRCAAEHFDGRIRNNLILHCNDVGVYLNRAARTEVAHNTLYATLGMDARFPDTDAVFTNNLLDGRIKARDGGRWSGDGNLRLEAAGFAARFFAPQDADFRLRDGSGIVAAGVPLPQVPDDLCGHVRARLPDIGAIEYGLDACDPAGRP